MPAATPSPHLFSPLTLRSVTARNRLWIAPMCMYSVFAEDGIPTDWHRVHYGSRAVGGAGVVIVEATAVEARGRISAHDLGIWNDEQGQAFAPIVEFMAEYGAVPAIQLAHAGRKAEVPGNIGPSPLAFSEKYATPREMSEGDIEDVVNAFVAGAERVPCKPDSRQSRSIRPMAICYTNFCRPSAIVAPIPMAAAWKIACVSPYRSSARYAMSGRNTCRSSPASALQTGPKAAGTSNRVSPTRNE